MDDLFSTAVLLDDAAIDHDDPVGEIERLLLVVRDEDARQRESRRRQLPQPLAQLAADVRVQRAERLVEQQHFRLDGQRARERDALPLTARKLRRADGFGQEVELHQIEQLAAPWSRWRSFDGR